MVVEKGVKIARSDPPAFADLYGAKLSVPDPASDGGLIDLQEVGDLSYGLKFFLGHL